MSSFRETCQVSEKQACLSRFPFYEDTLYKVIILKRTKCLEYKSSHDLTLGHTLSLVDMDLEMKEKITEILEY